MFCDFDPVTLNLSPAAVQDFIDRQCVVRAGQLINRSTGRAVKALMPVHLYGQSADVDPLMALACQYRLKGIEDAAQAIGTEYKNGVRVGAICDIGCFSFFPTKNLGVFGDAGLCTTNDADLAERMRVQVSQNDGLGAQAIGVADVLELHDGRAQLRNAVRSAFAQILR